jgi:4a-hydroxytetrahydrobiopterin dehydratase
LKEQLDGWAFEQAHLAKTYHYPDFAGALEFVNKIGAISEEQGHHPDIYMTWGKVSVEIWTHKIDGLTESDFILAAKFDEVPIPNQETVRAASRDDDSDPNDLVDANDDFDGAADADDFDDSEDFDDER